MRAQQSVMTQVRALRATVAVGGEGGNPMLRAPAQSTLQACGDEHRAAVMCCF